MGWWYFAELRRSSTARGNHGGELDGFVNESIEMMDNPMRAASVGRGGAAEEARYSVHEPPGRRQSHGNPTGNGMVDENNYYVMQPPGRRQPNGSTSAGSALEEARYSGYEPPVTEQRVSGVDGGPVGTNATASTAATASTIIYAIPLEDEDDGGAAVVARVPNQSSLYYDADPVPSEEMAAASVLNAAASTTAMTSAPAGAAGKCARPSPSGGVCKKAAVPGTLFCKGHTCPAPGCTAGKSTKMATCPSHVHVNIDGPRPAVGEVFYDAFGGAADNDNDHDDGAAQSSSPAAPHTNGAIYAVSVKQSARTAAVADGEGDANVMNC